MKFLILILLITTSFTTFSEEPLAIPAIKKEIIPNLTQNDLNQLAEKNVIKV